MERTYEYDDPTPIGARARELSGREFVQELIDRDVQVPVAATNNFRLVEVGEGHCVFETEAAPYLYNPIGTVHGGWYAAVLDAPLGVALDSTLPAGVGYTTLELKVNFVRAVRPEDGTLRCEGRLIHRGRTTAVTEATMKDARGRLFAHATCTCLIIDRRPKAVSGSPGQEE